MKLIQQNRAETLNSYINVIQRGDSRIRDG